MNATQASPELVLNLDRPRKACFNARAMNALEQYFEEKTGIRRIWEAMDWQNLNTRDATRILWAALLTDADDHNEVLTYEQLEKILDLTAVLESLGGIVAIVENLVERALPAISSDDVQAALDRIQKKTAKKSSKKGSPATEA